MTNAPGLTSRRILVVEATRDLLQRQHPPTLC